MRLLSDDYFIEERLTMEICHRGQTYRSINEMVLKGVHAYGRGRHLHQ